MTWMNEYDIDYVATIFNDVDTPNLYSAAVALEQLATWANENSDGWAYWPKPSRAAKRLQEVLQAGQAAYRRGAEQDCTPAELRAALTPVKAFLTRQGASLDLVSQ